LYAVWSGIFNDVKHLNIIRPDIPELSLVYNTQVINAIVDENFQNIFAFFLLVNPDWGSFDCDFTGCAAKGFSGQNNRGTPFFGIWTG
jgi:hypothetical protein